MPSLLLRVLESLESKRVEDQHMEDKQRMSPNTKQDYISDYISIRFFSEPQVDDNDLLDLFDEDITLIVDDQEFVAQRNWLSRQSDYFRALLNSAWSVEYTQEKITLQETSPNLFAIVLESFQTKEIQIPLFGPRDERFDIFDFYDLYRLYQRYLFLPALEAIVHHLNRILDQFGWNSVWKLWDFVAHHEEDFFFKGCLDWISANQERWPEKKTAFSFKHFRSMSRASLKIFLNYDANISEFFYLIATIKWIKHNKNDEKQSLELLKKVRVSLLSWGQLKECDSFIPESLLSKLYRMWQKQMYKLLHVGEKLKIVNSNYKCDLAKDVCYVTNPSIIKQRGLCVPDENLVYKPMIKSTGSDSSSVMIDLRFPFWINELKLELSANIEDKFRYLIECSVDGRDWKLLFDYSKYICSAQQMLIFKPTVMRYVRLQGQVQERLKTHTCRPIDDTNVVDFKAFYRPRHNYYSYGLRNGLYVSPFHIYMIKSSIYSTKHDPQSSCRSSHSRSSSESSTESTESSGSSTTECSESSQEAAEYPPIITYYLQIDQPVHVSKFSLTFAEGYQLNYAVDIYNAHKETYEPVHNRSRELCRDVQHISFTDRPVNLIRVCVKNIVPDEGFRVENFRLRNMKFFTLDELKSCVTHSEPRWENCWPLS